MESTVSATIFTTFPRDTITPNITNTTQGPCEPTEVSAHPAFMYAYSLVFLVSLVLNCITMRVYFCSNQRVQSSVMVYMRNLVAADFFLCLCLPLRIVHNATYSRTIRNIYCSFGASAFYINMYASILFMDFIAVNRYLKIVQPLETHALQTLRTARQISIGTWISLLAMSSVYLILFLQTSSDHDQNVNCESLHSHKLSVVYKIIHCMSFAVFAFVLVSLVFLYWKTLQKIQQAQLSTQTVSSHHKFNKSKRNILVLVVVFCVCFVPYHLVRLPYVFSSNCTFNTLKELTILLSVLNVCFDPLIYFMFCKAFREQLRKKDLQRSSEDKT
ncbi:P2Y purinoceptor 14 [Carassius gibelio]|uniref:P2Y purinoceptor 14 n=1 Tax=Carassius gibelio TaxID=101364 RepID=UPI002278DBC4|nr:P2Y purinoceptor 14 [Carassius gibelio]XP_052433133.1 P2Y purinoceptor 14 [Carassius gibelio]